MKTVGILGGMGPAAGADFLERLVAAHGGVRDQDHPPCLLYSATQVPDRTAHLLGEGPDPGPALAAAVRVVAAAGADFIVIPCNTAHAFLEQIRRAAAIPVLDLLAIAVAAVVRQAPDARRVGLLAADGTVKARLYDPYLFASGLEPVYPAPALQAGVMDAIRAIKGGARAVSDSDPRLVEAATELVGADAEAILMACTEVPLGLLAADCPAPLIDANQALVEATLAVATESVDPTEIPGSERPDGAVGNSRLAAPRPTRSGGSLSAGGSGSDF